MLIDIANCQIRDSRVEAVAVFIVNDQYSQSLIDKFAPSIKVVKCERHVGSHSLFPVIKLNFELYRFKPTILHFHAAEINRIVLVHGVRVLTVHNTGYDPKTGPWFKACYAISEAVKNEWGERGVQTKLVANGISCLSIEEKENYWEGDGLFKIIQVSRILFVQKGQDLALKAIAGLKKMGITNIQLTFIGDGEDYNSLTKMVEDYGLEGSVILEGVKERDWIYEHLKDYDLFLQPSRFEGFGLTVAEACAAKLPVLVSDNEGPLEIICNGKYGSTFKNKDIDSLIHEIQFIMSDYKRTVPIAQAAREHVIYKYDISNTAKKYIDEYVIAIHK